MSVRLICVGSSSNGNSYALDAGSEILLIEAGCRLPDVKKAIGFRMQDVVGCLVSHAHLDHAKSANLFARNGIHIYCNQDVADKKGFPFGSATVLQASATKAIGSFRVGPIELHHDVPNFGYLIHHPDMGTLLFASDTYKMSLVIKGIDHWLIEANYDDRILKANVEDGRIDRAQANRLMLSHMSLDNTIHYLHECGVGEATKTITLCHLSERNSYPKMFADRVAAEFGVPTQIASKGIIVTLNKEII